MKATRSMMVSMGILTMSACLMFFSACEKDGDTDTNGLNGSTLFDSSFDREFDAETRKDQGLTAEPESGTVSSAGNVLTFRVGGGRRPYTWTVSTSTAGSISPTTTQNEYESVKYTASQRRANTITVTDYDGRSVAIPIYASTTTLSISPSTASFQATDVDDAAQQLQFSSSGGVSPVTWSVSHPSMSAISGSGLWTNNMGYTATAWSNTTITVTLTDSDQSTTTATITFK